MTGKIAPPLPLPPVMIPGGRAAPDGDAATGGDGFSQILQQLCEGKSITVDFLDQGSQGSASAKPFNADGFFERLESALARRADSNSSMHPAVPSANSYREQADAPKLDRPEPDASRATLEGRHPGRDPTSARLELHRLTTLPGTNAMSQASSPILAPGHAPAARTSTSAGENERPLSWSRSPPTSGRPREMFKLLVEEAAIHISGPIHQLSDEETGQLIEEVADILEQHGLSLSDLWLNGRRAPTPRKQS